MKTTNDGTKGGLLVGNSHENGGIKVIVTDAGNRPIEVEGKEVIITAPAVEDPAHRTYSGTNREILSEINQSGGGVPILRKGGAIEDYPINKQGGYNYEGEAKSRAKKVDLLTLPKNISTNCGNCKYFVDGFCRNKEIMLPVTNRMCCALWDNDGSLRSWDIKFEKGGELPEVDNLQEKIQQRLEDRQKTKEFKDTSVVTYTRKYRAAYDIITLGDLQEIEKDNVTAYKLIEKSKIWPLYNIADQKEKGINSGAVYFKVKAREALSARPLDKKEAREVYVKNIEKLKAGLESLKTTGEVRDFLQNFVEIDTFDLGDISFMRPTAFMQTSYTGNYNKQYSRDVDEYFYGIFGKKFYNFCKMRSDSAKKTFAEAMLYDEFTKETREYVVNKNYSATILAVDRFKTLLSLIKDLDEEDYPALKKAFEEAGIKSYPMSYKKSGLTAMAEQNIKAYGSITKEQIDKHLPKHYTVRENDWSWADKDKPEAKAEAKEAKPLPPENIFQKYGLEEPKVIKRKPLDYIKRTGGLAIGDISTKSVIENFGYKNIIYGNYVNDKESKEHTNHVLGSMLDLVELCNIDIKDINKLGGLDINIGATGCGAFSTAAACYFASLKAINITKKRGDGALGHEWSHYLDNILAEGSEKKATNINWATDAKAGQLKSARVSLLFSEFKNWMNTGGQARTIKVKFYPQKAYMYSLYGKTLEESIELIQTRKPFYKEYKNSFDKNVYRYYGYMAYKFNENKPIEVDLTTSVTNYWAISSMYPDTEYMTDPKELFARAFEGWLEYALEKRGRVNNYLVDTASFLGIFAPFVPKEKWPYPSGEELVWLNDWFERLFSAIRVDYNIKPFNWNTTERIDEYTDYANTTDSKVDSSVKVTSEGETIVDGEAVEEFEKGYGFRREYLKDKKGEARIIYRLLNNPYGSGKGMALGGEKTEVIVFPNKFFTDKKEGYDIAFGQHSDNDIKGIIASTKKMNLEEAKKEAVEFYKGKPAKFDIVKTEPTMEPTNTPIGTSILYQDTDLKGNPKEDWMLNKDDFFKSAVPFTLIVNDNKYWEKVHLKDAEKIKLNVAGKFYVGKVADGYYVVERESGARLGFGKTKNKAVQSAMDLIEKNPSQNVKQSAIKYKSQAYESNIRHAMTDALSFGDMHQAVIDGRMTATDAKDLIEMTPNLITPEWVDNMLIPKRADIKLSTEETEAIADIITTDKYRNLTPISGAVLFKFVKSNIDTIEEIMEGEDDLSDVEIEIEPTEQEAAILEELDTAGYATGFAYTKFTISFHPKAIEFYNSVLARIDTIEGVRSGTDLFPELAQVRSEAISQDVYDKPDHLLTLEEFYYKNSVSTDKLKREMAERLWKKTIKEANEKGEYERALIKNEITAIKAQELLDAAGLHVSDDIKNQIKQEISELKVQKEQAEEKADIAQEEKNEIQAQAKEAITIEPINVTHTRAELTSTIEALKILLEDATGKDRKELKAAIGGLEILLDGMEGDTLECGGYVIKQDTIILAEVFDPETVEKLTRSRGGNLYAKGAQIKSIEDDTDLLTEVIAQTVAERTMYAYDVAMGNPAVVTEVWATLSPTEKAIENENQNKFIRDLTNYLTTRAETIYKNNPDFRMKVRGKGNMGRDYLYTFMQHWANGWVLQNKGAYNYGKYKAIMKENTTAYARCGGYMKGGGEVGSSDVVSIQGKEGAYHVVSVDPVGKTATVLKIGEMVNKPSYSVDLDKMTILQKWGKKTGGAINIEGVDLFEDYENTPKNVQKILDKYKDAFEDGDYEGLAAALKEMNKIGYTFEYYLDGQAYDLRKIGEKGKAEVALKEDALIRSVKESDKLFDQKMNERDEREAIVSKIIKVKYNKDFDARYVGNYSSEGWHGQAKKLWNMDLNDLKTQYRDGKQIAHFKDEGDFYSIQLTKDGKLPENKMYEIDELTSRTFPSKKEAENFAAYNAWTPEFEFKRGGGLCPVGTQIQTIIFDKEQFTEKQAKDWAQKNDMLYGYVDEKENTYRIRQREPSNFTGGSFRTINLDKGINAVIGCPKI